MTRTYSPNCRNIPAANIILTAPRILRHQLSAAMSIGAAALDLRRAASHICVMAKPFYRRLLDSPLLRPVLFGLGILLMLVSPLAGILPGPGGIIVFAIGLGLALRNSAWAKRKYVDFKRRFPKSGGWADWGLRRDSAKRRDEQKKAKDVDNPRVGD